jgi:HK97 family phage major capsid protein
MPNILPAVDSLRSMDASGLAAAMAAIDLEIAELDQDPDGELRHLSPAEEQHLEKLLSLRNRVDAHAKIRKQYDHNPAAVQHAMAGDRGNGSSAPQVVFRGDPWSDTTRLAPDAPGHRSELRGRALTAVEKMPRLSDAAKQVATLAIEDDDDREARMARYTVELSRPAYFSAFRSWFNDPTTGPHTWSPEERDAVKRVQEVTRAMALSPGTAGGFLTPFELDPNLIISSAGSVDPMRNVARVTQTLYNEKRFVTTLGSTASWDAEAAQVSDDSPALLQPTITCHKGAAYIESSYELDEDSDLAQQVATVFADSKAQLESNAFTLGSGSGQPWGVVQRIVSSHAGSIIATGTNVLGNGDPVANQNALPARWRPRAKFMANLTIINGYRALIKATGLTESLVDDSASVPRIYGWEIVENSSMDSSLTGAAADYLLLSGDFSQYAIVDRLGTSIVPVPVVVGANFRPTGSRG